MDDEARNRLAAQAVVQHAIATKRRAKTNLALGVVVIAAGIGLLVAVKLLPVALVGSVLIGGLGMVAIPGGVAIVVRSIAAIVESTRQIRRDGYPAESASK